MRLLLISALVFPLISYSQSDSTNKYPRLISEIFLKNNEDFVTGRTIVQYPEYTGKANSCINFSYYDLKKGDIAHYQLVVNSLIAEITRYSFSLTFPGSSLLFNNHFKETPAVDPKFFENQLIFFIDNIDYDCLDCEWDMNISINDNFSKFIILNVYSQIYLGGLHGFYREEHKLIRKADGRLLRLNDIVTDTAALSQIAEKLFRIDQQIPKGESLKDAGYWFNDEFMCSDNFFIENGVIQFVYNEYEIAPYSVGTVKLQIPLSEIRHLLKIDVSTLP